MNILLWLAMLVAAALTIVTRDAAAEIILSVDEELRRAEQFREYEAQRRSRQSPAKMRMLVDPDKDLRMLERGIAPNRHIPDARYRVAVFTFEDPDNTKLGNAIAAIVGREALLRSNVGSIGVLRYEGSLAPSSTQPLSYFDKVDLLVEAQNVSLAVWGMLRRSGDGIFIDTYLQLPPRVVEENFRWALRLPDAMGGAKLLAHLRPARILVQRQYMSFDDARSLVAVAKNLDTLRAEPQDAAGVVATLPMGSMYWVNKHEGEWIEVVTDTHRGWVRSAGHCIGDCAALLDAARFAAEMLGFIETRRIPETAATLATDAKAVQTQLSTLEQLDTARPGQFQAGVLRPLAPWVNRAASGAATPPGGAAFANIRALSKVATSLQAAMRRSDEPLEERFNEVKLDPSRVREIAFELAESSVQDPRNTDVLNNLAILFGYAGEGERAELAARLAVDASRQRP